MVQLMPTGIRGLDEILLGGIIRNIPFSLRESPAQASPCLASSSSITVRWGSTSRA
jgi:hypothetical protein